MLRLRHLNEIVLYDGSHRIKNPSVGSQEGRESSQMRAIASGVGHL